VRQLSGRSGHWRDIYRSPSSRTTGHASAGPCFAEAFTGDDPLLRHVRTRVRSPQTNGVVERFFDTLTYEHLYHAFIGDGTALAVEVNCFRQTYNTLRPHQAPVDRTPRQAYLATLRSR
jgi:hypothetical protein